MRFVTKPVRIGHGGASALVRANTIASFETALEIGVDVIEFDVRAAGRRLVLAHSSLDARRGDPPRLQEALAFLSRPRFDGVALHVDLKQPGTEAGALEALGRFGLLDRALICSHRAVILDRVRALDPEVQTGFSVGNRLVRRMQRLGDWRGVVIDALRERRFSALMAFHPLVDERLVADVADTGGEVYAWTVDQAAAMRRLAGIGVAGITSGDPRLFATSV